MNRKVTIFCLSLLPLTISAGMVYSILPIYISEELKASKVVVGALFTSGALTGVITSILIGKLSDMFGRKIFIILSQISFALVMLLYSFIDYFMYAFPIHILEGFAWASISTIAPTYIADLTRKNERGKSMGFYNMIWSLGWVIGPILGGILAELFGFRLMLRSAFIMLTLGLIFLISILYKY
ncbi:MAG TPA: MFS transporter [Archaeoglobus profundus]|nr:MFS transporter [Archaeoglobus profundus]HIP57806.1 MFS transporter [Archaeoglobus profundus]